MLSRLRHRLASLAVSRVHVLVVEVPGWWTTRVTVEQALVARGWPAATSPADADVLVVCGDAGVALAAAVDQVWEQLPGPRARVTVLSPDEVPTALERAASLLLDDDHQVADARDRPAWSMGGGGGGHGEMDHGEMGDGEMDHGDMDMAPDGIPLASGGDDRDGLEMDVLHVPLGPVLPAWPAGLVLHCTLQGDVVTAAEVDVLGAHGAAPHRGAADTADFPGLRAARLCDSAAQLLDVAGWAGAADSARRTRDALLTGDSEGVRRLDRLASRVATSRLLRWSLRDLGRVNEALLREHRLPARMRGDAHDRLLDLLERARAEVGDYAAPERSTPGAWGAALPPIVTGLDLAAVRLVVASLAPDTTESQSEPVGA